MSATMNDLVEKLWTSVRGDTDMLDMVTFTGPRRVLPSVYDVTGFAAATIATANLAVAQLQGLRTGTAAPRVTVDRRQAGAAFLSEALFTPDGWERPAVWDPIAGDYLARDGWIRLHTNYRNHRDAVLRVLGVEAEREAVTRAVAACAAQELEDAVIDAGGCAAVMHDRDAWLASPPGIATRDEPVLRVEPVPSSARDATVPPPADRPLAGVRVLDLTRVIAGPVCTRFLAAFGADVLRIDPVGFDEVPALVPDTTVGKRCAALDLHDTSDRERFVQLLADADVVVSGYRPGALDALGFDAAAIRATNPGIVTAALDAYGWSGPWARRRGFDSLVQMSCGIAAAGAAAKALERPFPLPAQALDHGTGYLVAAAVVVALAQRCRGGGSSDVRASLIGTANTLVALHDPDGIDAPAPSFTPADTIACHTTWGDARRVPPPGVVDGIAAGWTVDAGPIGRHAATFEPAYIPADREMPFDPERGKGGR